MSDNIIFLHTSWTCNHQLDLSHLHLLLSFLFFEPKSTIQQPFWYLWHKPCKATEGGPQFLLAFNPPLQDSADLLIFLKRAKKRAPYLHWLKPAPKDRQEIYPLWQWKAPSHLVPQADVYITVISPCLPKMAPCIPRPFVCTCVYTHGIICVTLIMVMLRIFPDWWLTITWLSYGHNTWPCMKYYAMTVVWLPLDFSKTWHDIPMTALEFPFLLSVTRDRRFPCSKFEFLRPLARTISPSLPRKLASWCMQVHVFTVGWVKHSTLRDIYILKKPTNFWCSETKLTMNWFCQGSLQCLHCS